MFNLFDSHVHSDNSPDGEHSVTFICQRAVQQGIMGLAITDHCEIDSYKEDSYELRMLQSIFDTRRAQLYFGAQLTISCGMELGQPLANIEYARRALELTNYDFVLASVHAIRGMPDFYYMHFNEMSPSEINDLMEKYFSEVLETVRWGNFDVLAHLTYPLRYIYRDGRTWTDGKEEQIRAILKALISAGKGLELNVSGLSGDFGRTMPEKDVLSWYRQLGGEIITIGCDAHTAEKVGRGVTQGMQLLKEAGFTHFAFYKKRAPRMLKLC